MKKNAHFFTKVLKTDHSVELKLIEDRKGNVSLQADMQVKATPPETWASEGFTIGFFEDGALTLNKLNRELAKQMGIQCDDNNKILIK